MKTLVQLARIAFLAFVAAVISSCGGDNGGDEPDHPPSISNLVYSPATAYQVAAGTVAITGSVDFTDAGGDVVSLRLMTSSGEDLTVPTPALSGVTTGTATGTVVVSVDKVGKYTFEMWLVDGKGSTSNHLAGTFEVLPAEPFVHPPSITSLRYTPASVLQSAGGSATISAEVDFADTGGDVVSFHVVSSAGTDLTLPMSNLSGVQTGTAVASFTLPIDTVGSITFEISLADGRGSDSNRLFGTFEVLPHDTTGNWEKLGVSPPNQLYGIGWNGSVYVAVGGNGTVMSSTNLTAWTVQDSGVTHTLRSVAASPSRFVAVGENAIGEAIVLSSVDGASWSVTYRAGDCQGGTCASPSGFSKAIWTGAQFVAVGMEFPAGSQVHYALALTSPDGTTWTKRAPQAIPLGDFAGQSAPRFVGSVAWSGSVLVLSALDEQWSPVVWVSPDADTWTKYETSPDAIWTVLFRDIIWGDGRFVAVNDAASMSGDAPVLTSVDGMNWIVDTNSTSLPPMMALASKPGEFLAVGDSYRLISTDGLVWAVSSHSADCGSGVLWDGTRYVAVGAAICRSQ